MPKHIEHKIIEGIEYKRCSKGHWDEISKFYHSSYGWDGLNNLCKKCTAEIGKKRYIKNRDKISENGKIHYKNNKEVVDKRNREYAINHKEEIGEYKKNWASNNKQKRNKQLMDRYYNDTNYRLAVSLRNRINIAIKNNTKHKKTLELLGCSIDEFKQYLENKFDENMTWDNHGFYWHIDHIRPCAGFDLSDPEQQKICFHHSNMQPLEAKANLIKGSTF